MTDDTPLVSIVVPNWEGEALLERCLSSLQISARRSGLTFELIVVDDASSDGSAALIRGRFPGAKLVLNSKNLGFARSVNRGARAARGRILVLANNDIAVQEGFIGEIVKWFLRKPGELPKGSVGDRLFAVSAKTVRWHDGLPNQVCMGAVWRGGRITPAWSDPSGPSPCLFVQAGAAAYDIGLFRELGGLATLYEPGYWEDYDISWRAAARGWFSIYDPAAFALHHGGGSMTRRFSAEGVAAMRARNHVLFEMANLATPRLLIEWAARVPLNFAREIASPCTKRRFTRAFFSALARLPDVACARFRRRSTLSDLSLIRPYRRFTPAP